MDCTRIFRTTTTTIWSPLQHALLTEGLNVNHLRLVTGTSMGCMHSFVWGETYRISWTR